MAAGQVPPAHAVELRDLAGWWIAVDDTFPKHWKARSIAPMEEVLQINPDGRVTNRVMNFWAGSHQACFENKVCSDLPQISNSRLRIAGTRIGFQTTVATTARLDTNSGDALVRRDIAVDAVKPVISGFTREAAGDSDSGLILRALGLVWSVKVAPKYSAPTPLIGFSAGFSSPTEVPD